MAKPGTYPTWDGGTSVDPGTTKKTTTGWVPGEKPPAQFLNWLFHWISQWINYLGNITAESLVWSAKHTFSAGLASGTAPSAATDVVRKNELDAEATARSSADSTEVTNRTNADNAEITARTNAINAEASTRASQDTSVLSTAQAYAAAQALAVMPYKLWVNADGSILDQSGPDGQAFTVNHSSTGTYRITHPRMSVRGIFLPVTSTEQSYFALVGGNYYRDATYREVHVMSLSDSRRDIPWCAVFFP
jgi:hypothetical protein